MRLLIHGVYAVSIYYLDYGPSAAYTYGMLLLYSSATSSRAAPLRNATIEYSDTHSMGPAAYIRTSSYLQHTLTIIMGVIGTLYANLLLSIANVSTRLFAPAPEYPTERTETDANSYNIKQPNEQILNEPGVVC